MCQSDELAAFVYLQHDDVFVEHLHSALDVVIIINLKHTNAVSWTLIN